MDTTSNFDHPTSNDYGRVPDFYWIMSRITQVIEKRKAGKPLDAEDRRTVLDDAKERRSRAIPLYFSSVEEKAQFLALASKDGVRAFSQWAITRLREVAQGTMIPRSVYESVRRDLDDAKKIAELERGRSVRLERETKDRAQALESKLAKAQAENDRLVRQLGDITLQTAEFLARGKRV